MSPRWGEDDLFCLLFPLLAVSLYEPYRRAEEIKFFTQAILQVSLVRKMQTRAPTGGEEYKRRRPHSDLRHVLHVQARDATLYRCRSATPARLSNSILEERVQLR